MDLVALDRAYKVDEAINTTDKSIVIVRFGRGSKKSQDGKKSNDGDKNDESIKQVDECLQTLTLVNNVPIKVYTVEMKAVPELVARYKLVDPVTVLFFRDNIQGGRLQGDRISKDEITKIVTDLATKQKKRREPSKIPTSSNTTNNNNNNNNKTETPGDFIDWFKGWLKANKLYKFDN